MPLTLAIDVGNSRVKFGLFSEARGTANAGSPLAVPTRTLSVSLADPVPWQELLCWTDGNEASAVIAGPNPSGVDRIRNDWRLPGCTPPRAISSPNELGLEVRVDFPERVGIDRLLNAVAANVLRPRDRLAIVVSSGTAMTVDLVSADGAFEGGVILPGFELAARSLHEHTALLPLIPISELSAGNVPALGKNTGEAIRSGLLYGQIGAVSELIERLADGREAFVILTGGGGALLSRYLSANHVLETDLVLRALAHVASNYSSFT